MCGQLRLVVPVLVLSVALALVACSGGDNGASEPPPTGTGEHSTEQSDNSLPEGDGVGSARQEPVPNPAFASGEDAAVPPQEPGIADEPGPATSALPSTSPLRFRGETAPIDEAARARMSWSWRPGCPVPLDDLRLLTLDHWGFDGLVHQGELVVHKDYADAVLSVMQGLFDARFPIARMEIVDVYEADDERSMAANNSSAFNCRRVADSNAWSEHAFGRAIDINPLVNPFVSSGGDVLPPAGTAYADRTVDAPGMIHPDDEIVRAFEAIDWTWGGIWDSSKDYQHFSATGR